MGKGRTKKGVACKGSIAADGRSEVKEKGGVAKVA